MGTGEAATRAPMFFQRQIGADEERLATQDKQFDETSVFHSLNLSFDSGFARLDDLRRAASAYPVKESEINQSIDDHGAPFACRTNPFSKTKPNILHVQY